MSKIIVFLATGFEEIEALTPVDYLRRADQEVVTVALSVGGKEAPLVSGSHGIFVKADKTFDDFILNLTTLPDAVIIPGGMPGAVNVAACEPALDFIKRMFQENKLVCAICAAPAVVLSKTGILAGRRYNCYPGMDRDIAKYCGSKEKAAELTKGARLCKDEPFVADGNLITGRGPGAAEQFAMAIVEKLCGKEKADKIKAASVQR